MDDSYNLLREAAQLTDAKPVLDALERAHKAERLAAQLEDERDELQA